MWKSFYCLVQLVVTKIITNNMKVSALGRREMYSIIAMWSAIHGDWCKKIQYGKTILEKESSSLITQSTFWKDDSQVFVFWTIKILFFKKRFLHGNDFSNPLKWWNTRLWRFNRLLRSSNGQQNRAFNEIFWCGT